MSGRWRRLSWEDWLMVACFALFLLAGLFVFDDYSVTSDELIERTTGLINYREIMGLTDTQIGNVDFSALKPLAEYRERFYGAVAQYIPLLAEHFFGFELSFRKIFLIRHLFTFGLFWLATVVFYQICLFLKCSKGEALLGSLFLILSPRILADSFYNIKDSVFLSLMVINLYSGLRFMEKQTLLRGVILAVISAICINVRILGAEVIALCLIAVGIQSLREKKGGSALGWIIFVTIASFTCYVLITPFTWPNIWEAVKAILDKFSNYTSWSGYNFYDGQALRGWEVPWHYLPVWILTTTPVLYLLLMAAGVIPFIKKVCTGGVNRFQWIMVLYAGIPLLYVVLRKPSLYNGWRHFYFVYPGLILAAVYGWRQIRRGFGNGKIAQTICVGGTAIYLMFIGAWIAQNHPLQCLYFNMPSRSYAAENLDKDYWCVAQKEAFEWICANDDRSQINVSGGFYSFLENSADATRFVTAEPYDYIVYSNVSAEESERFDGLYLKEMVGTVSYLFDGFELYDPVYEVCVDNITVCTVYKRSHNKIESANLKWDQGQLQYDLNGIFWEMSSNEDGVYLTGQLHEVQQGNRVGIQSDCGVLPAIVEISLDGRSWIPFSSQTALLRDGTRMQINLDAGKISQIRLVFDKIAFDIEKSWNIHVGVYQENEYIDTWRDKPLDIGGAVATKGVGAEGFAYDGNISTRWDASQKPGVSYTLELTKVYELAGITVDYGEYRDDYPRKLSFYGSMDGENWFSISAEDCGGGYFRLMPQKVRYLQMVLEEESEWNWSICEIKCWITP